ncbi:pre-mRNA-splicing factor CLF1 [Coprinopsis cinerea AmutBmut pab1-1]|nr:pre-mRNA-splicing factor CLF1 [Coprinopsis cinerea AmutBmut pab1-1]
MSTVVGNVKSLRNGSGVIEVVCKCCPQLFQNTGLNLLACRKEWLQYANWEASQNEFARSRSVFERALDVDPSSIQIWLSYTEKELKNRNVQHARNLFDRAVTLLPRVDQLWYKYVYLEELLGNVSGARQVFERWVKWEPDEKAWMAYIRFEERYQEMERVSALYERVVAVSPEVKTWIRWARFEEERGCAEKAREVFRTAVEFYGEEPEDVERAQGLYAAFAKMETRLKEYERARVVYKFALDRIPRSKCAALYDAYTKFEKQHGSTTDLEASVIAKRRIQNEEEVQRDGRNYDVWFDYVNLEEGVWQSLREEGFSAGERDEQGRRVEEVYERAIALVPPGDEKRHWRRYIYLWLRYALFEEVERKDYERAREVYKTAISVVPHQKFTFTKLWLSFAKFEVRMLELGSARKILGTGIGLCPKPSLFRGYIDLEIEVWVMFVCRLASGVRSCAYALRKVLGVRPHRFDRLGQVR